MNDVSDVPGVWRKTGRFGEGWEARVRSGQSKETEYFADSKHGGIDGSRAAAEKWARATRLRLGLPPDCQGSASSPDDLCPPGVYFSKRDRAWITRFTDPVHGRIELRFGRSAGWDGKRAPNNLARAGFTGEEGDERAMKAAIIARLALEMIAGIKSSAHAWALQRQHGRALIAQARKSKPRFER